MKSRCASTALAGFAAGVFASAHAWSELDAVPPAATPTDESIVGAKRLTEQIAGTYWLHKYRGNEFPFVFGVSGLIEQHWNWRGTTWRAVSANQIILVGVTGAQMVFTFDLEKRTFTTLDWDGVTPTSGRLVLRDVPFSSR